MDAIINTIINTYRVDCLGTIVFQCHNHVIVNIRHSRCRIIGIAESTDTTVIQQRCIGIGPKCEIRAIHIKFAVDKERSKHIKTVCSIISFLKRALSQHLRCTLLICIYHSDIDWRGIIARIVAINRYTKAFASIEESILQVNGTQRLGVLGNHQRRVVHQLLEIRCKVIVLIETEIIVDIPHLNDHAVTRRVGYIGRHRETYLRYGTGLNLMGALRTDICILRTEKLCHLCTVIHHFTLKVS